MSDEFEKLSAIVGCAEAKRMLEPRDRTQYLPGHGISPAQLREKVEALQERANRDADKHNRLCDVVADQMHRLDAALKRIELLERDMGDVHPNALSGGKR